MVKRLIQTPACPGCGGDTGTPVDRKLVYRLSECTRCGLLYRYPHETAAEMRDYYQEEYAANEHDLTVVPPSPDVLQHLRETNFAGTEIDFSGLLRLFGWLGVSPGARVLDYGASWGYSLMQLQAAGYQAEGFEISHGRADYGRRLGLTIHEKLDLAGSRDAFDVVFSSHVLEHVPNPAASLREQLSMVRPGGYVVALTPNGSAPFRRAEPWLFHRCWGLPHPVLLSDTFVRATVPEYPLFLTSAPTSKDYAAEVQAWDRKSLTVGDLSQGHLVVVVHKPAVA